MKLLQGYYKMYVFMLKLSLFKSVLEMKENINN